MFKRGGEGMRPAVPTLRREDNTPPRLHCRLIEGKEALTERSGGSRRKGKKSLPFREGSGKSCQTSHPGKKPSKPGALHPRKEKGDFSHRGKKKKREAVSFR